MLRRLSHILLAALVAAPVALADGAAVASPWMFRESYYSHRRPPAAARLDYGYDRTGYRRPFVHTRPGAAIRGGYRFNRVTIPSGSSNDTTVIREDWFQLRPFP